MAKLARGPKLPKLMETAVKRIKQSSPNVNPYAVASATLQKSGSLKQGANTPTKQGVKRGQMSRAQRHRTAP
jgi:hypothetical protein